MSAVLNVVLRLLLALSAIQGVEQTGPPRDSEVTERVEVDLVLLDVTVLDRRREVVSGLTRDDFVLRIDDRKTPIVSLDMQCPDAPAIEPPAVDPDHGSDWSAPDRTRRIVLALDYRHLERTQRVEIIEQVRAAVTRLHRSKEQLMIVALTDYLRIEQPWTSDGEVALAALERMENDITLWEPPFDHLHDGPTFSSLLDLTDLLGLIEGEKIVVLYSNWPSSGFHYDVQFSELASRSARKRVSFYPVWARGLTAYGTSRSLARLAVETGGRFTERTNDFSLGYARAQRDSTCRYTIGFHDSGEDPDRVRRVVLRVDRRGVRVFHHDRYAPANPDDTRTQTGVAALAWPEPYLDPSVAVAVLPLYPTGRKRWETVLAVQAIGVGEEPVQVRADFRRGNTRWVRPSEQRLAPFSVSDPYRLRSGSYLAAATVSYAGESTPRAASTRIDLPTLEGDGWLLVDPIVLRALGGGRVAAEDLEGTELEGDPLLGRVPVLLQANSDDALFVAGQLCRHGRPKSADTVSATVEISITGRPVFSASARLAFGAGDGVHCQAVDERIPQLAPGLYDVIFRAQPPGFPPMIKRSSFAVIPPS